MTTGKHIVVISTSFPAGEPGSEAAGSFVSDFVQELSEHIKVTVMVPSRRRMADEEHTNLTVRYFLVPRLPLSLLSPLNPTHWISIIQVMLSGQRTLTQTVMESKIDHILALWAIPSAYWARNIWKRHGIPYSTWALGSDIWTLGKIPFVKKVLKRVLKESQVCFADGYELKSEVETLSKRPCEFLASARKLPLEGKKQLSRTPPYKLAFLGRWHSNKGIDLLLDSLRGLSDEDWVKIDEIRICGGGVLEEKVKSDATFLKKLGKPIKVEGYLDKAGAVDLLAWADYLLIPSRIESIPVVFSDAMQAGCSVVAMPVGDLPRLLNEYSVGILAADVSSQAFVVALRSALATSPEQYQGGMENVRMQFDVRQTSVSLLNFLGI